MLEKPFTFLSLKQLNQIRAHIIKSSKPNLLNSLLRSLAQANSPHDALLLYNQMLHEPTSHDHFTYTYALKACSLLHAIPKGHEIHSRIITSGHHSDIFIQNTLLNLYVDFSDIIGARKVFDTISKPDVVSWTSMISGLAKNGFEEEALLVLVSMDVKPNSMTLVCLLSACARLRALDKGKEIHAYCFRNLNGDNVIVDNAILELYVKCGSLSSAQLLFETMRNRDVVSWTTIVCGYAQNGFCQEAITVFRKMANEGEVKPNEATIVSVLSACASLGFLSLGQRVHTYIDKIQSIHGVTLDGHHVGNSLVNMYAKCGNLGMALRVFNHLPCKDLVAWSTIIGGMAMNGYGMEALQMFSLMLCNGVAPDGVTFLGLLSACSHSRLVNQGRAFFSAMRDVYWIRPEIEHYACMVDLYGRAGLLDEAESFIRDMPMKPDGVVCVALLNACKIHGDDKVDERFARCLVGERRASGGSLALLSNTYASASRWEEFHRVREVMRRMGVRKTPGCSWVEIDEPIPS
ncbi:pentatricopeptide repeat-containing protein At1g08070, chloroplastic-like [Macadamia integrifolia]|uniref:pentatricopeptide repeat-containing protein At1g08070, chloroplastic-like n=1 Tax=Macadamia integrifolia TaxID=60698 RepID=UPI001C4FAFB2|nr:pentatricopeptide repeat-containing protein At1g08070, chloroplastic-like [Macadamia integrifolia]